MRTRICPTCGCSLVRLGISKRDTVIHNYDGEEHSFCCSGCVDLFIDEPDKFLAEINKLAVCPTCLAEKPIETTIKFVYEEKDFHFCRCPSCIEEFKKNPEYFANRLVDL